MNAKKEFLEEIENKPNLKCAKVKLDAEYRDNVKEYRLKVGYNKEELNSFIDSLDFEYANGYGGQELYGIIWFDDGTYCDRGEYDGSEWWDYHKTPKIPEELLKDSK